MFTAYHPVPSSKTRGALSLRLRGGLITVLIARPFLVPAPTVAQRIVRAQSTLAAARAPFAGGLPHRQRGLLAIPR